MRPALCALLAFAIAACHTEPNPASVTLATSASTPVAVATTAPPAPPIAPLKAPTSARDFFPDEANGGFTDFVRDWYGGVLLPMHEPSLWQASKVTTRESWRFLWLRTWGHPVAIRFDVDASGATMRYVELDGQAGYKPGAIRVDRTRHVTAAEWSTVNGAIAKMGFWTMKTTSPDMGNDGLEWVIEGSSGGRWHVTDRWTPSDDTARRGLVDYLATCKAAFDLSGASDPFE